MGCEEKMTFDTKRVAQAAATSLKWQRDTLVGVYQCNECSLWHLTREKDQVDE